MKKRPFYIQVLCLLVTALALAAVLWGLGWLFRGDVTGKDVTDYRDAEGRPNAQLAAAIKARDVNFTPSKVYHIFDDPWTFEHKAAPRPKPSGQSPILRELADEKVILPLKDRLPEEPYVSVGYEKGKAGIGRYGGTWLRVATSPGDVGVYTWRMNGISLARWSPLGYPIQPFVAKKITPSADKKEWTVTLRKGMKWSDGHPFTADDIIFWWDDNVMDKSVWGIPPDWMMVGGKSGHIERVKAADAADADAKGFDKYRVKFVFPRPQGMFMEMMAIFGNGPVDSPRHYLQQWHPTLGDGARCARAMAAYKLGNRRALYGHMRDYRNPRCPRLWTWICREYRASPPYVFVRNPYYFAIDTKGNQLPYIDRLQFDVQPKDTLAVTAINGMISMQTRHIEYKNYTDYMSRRDESGTRILHWYPATRSIYALNPNHLRYVDPDDPSTAYKAKLLADKRFRQALSLAIDREKIIDAEYNGQVEAAQVSPGRASPFRHDKLRTAFIEHDPPQAGKLLDALADDGLLGKGRDSEGYRTFPDGSRMVFYIDFCPYTGVGPTEFVVRDWGHELVGVRAIARSQSRPLLYTRKNSMDFDFNIWSSASDYLPLCSPRYFVAYHTECFYAVGWGRWFMRGGFYTTPEENPDAYRGNLSRKPPEDHPMYRSMQVLEAALQAPTLEKQVEVFSEALDIAAEQLWTINLTTGPPQLVVVKKDFRNVPDNALYGNIFHTPDNARVETFYFEDPSDSKGAREKTRQTLASPTLRPGDLKAMGRQTGEASPGAGGGPEDGGTDIVGGLIKWSVLVIVVLVVVLLALRHPYIARRLVIMIPTLLIISVLVFTIIQLPPGDYLTALRIQLEESGDPADAERIEEIRDLFHFDESPVSRYVRWLGLRWFMPYASDEKAEATEKWEKHAAQAEKAGQDPPDKPGLGFFRAENEGLLQGNLGKSMEDTGREVNEIVGDRIWLTMGISLGTILFTWAIAIPVGIYSAVKQYSLGDYVLTFVGFIGMCVPAFLLALILMVLSGQSGLFSAEYATQPEWTWGKFWNLMEHIWIPVVVLGVGGTAGMIRVMRANLLDELKKPYVITAMAKGVRPGKLLMKYPVRLALNPFVSGIGGLFPRLVSGGAIVAYVLTLPTVGPLMIESLFAEDMYMAGSLLMVLSTLAVLGTLVSDMLLLWLDPRIRFKGGTR